MSETPERTSKTTLSWKKRVVFGLIVTVAFFLGVECALALVGVQPTLADRDPYVGFQSSIPLYVEQGGALQTAPNKLKFFNLQRFARQKPEGTYRVFCLGGSTTFGRPYDDTTSYAGWLRELLPLADSNRRWEVINAGGISYASYRVAEVLDELTAYSPDLFVVYTGHNEFLEERTYRNLRAQPSALRTVESMLHQTRTYSFAHRLCTSDPPSDDSESLLPSEVDAILDHSVGPESYHRDDSLRSAVSQHFQFNLNRMVTAARAAGAEIVFVTPAANLKDFSPFKSEHRSGLPNGQLQRWQELVSQASELAEQGNHQQAIAALQSAASIDDRPAELHYRIGKSLFAQQQFAESRQAFRRAVDEDVCPLRVLPELQQIIEQVAIGNHVPLIDFDSIIKYECRRSYGHDSPGREFFIDHVHPTIAAHRLLATSIMEAMIQRGIVAPSQDWGDEAIIAATRRIESRIDPEMQSRALTNLAQVLSWAGKQDIAGPLAIDALRVRSEGGLASDAESMFYAAVHYAVTGSDAQAIDLFQQVVDLEPTNSEARWRLATLLFDQDDHEQAELHFREAVKLNPTDGQSHQMLGAILLQSARYEQALQSFQRAAELQPQDAAIRDNIALTLEKMKAEAPSSVAGHAAD